MPARDKEQPPVRTVTQLTKEVKGLLEGQIGSVWVGGEISNWRVSPAGHAYFTLKDESSQLSAVMFRGSLNKLKMEPESGLEVVVHGRISVYEQRGQYQIICDSLQPKGVGALQLAFDKLKKKLADEGLFDETHKKELPMLPRRIGVVTSPTGAAIRDMLNVIDRRFANVNVIIYPARVQGDEAPPEIVHGIHTLDEREVDVIIIGRGGGSLEDLWAFNDERVVCAVYGANTPIISAVGHEIDFSLSDFAADVRAPTPSAAAELVVQERAVLTDRVHRAQQRMTSSLRHRIEHVRGRMNVVAASAVLRRPGLLVEQARQRLDDARERVEGAVTDQAALGRIRLDRSARSLILLSPHVRIENTLERIRALVRRIENAGKHHAERKRARLEALGAQLHNLSPLAILDRGYAVAWKLPDGDLVRDAHALSPGDKVLLRFGKGAADATIDRVKEEENDG